MSEFAFKPGDKVAFIHNPSKPLIVLAFEKIGTGKGVDFSQNVIVGTFDDTIKNPTLICSKRILKHFDEEDVPPPFVVV